MRTRSLVRPAAATAAGLALGLSALALPAAANAAPPAATQTATQAKPALSIKASTTKVKAWSKFTLTGKATGIKSGSKVSVQRFDGKKWNSFPASTVVTRSGNYSVWIKSGRVGVNTFRVASGKVASQAVKVNVTK